MVARGNNRTNEQSNGNDPRELLKTWLNDAYAMEQTLVSALENHAKDAEREHQPEVAARIQRHADETRHQAERVRQCVERLGGRTSAVKTGLGMVFGQMKELAKAGAKDELVKNNLADIATEHFEMACYQSLIAAANDLGEREVAQVCREIFQEEQAMARWLEEQLPQTTVTVLHNYAGVEQA